ncbi:MAG TPA: SGNH/GDSL hydrolase family protein [Marmoricola sp.]
MGYLRFVALGDSQTEGLNDLDASGVPVGWADRLAQRLAATTSPGLTYANLAVRRCRAAHVRDVQLPAALALAPDLATVAVGMNDVLRHDCDIDAVAVCIEETVAALRATGCTVALMTFPDIGRMIPLMSWLRPRERRLNAAVGDIAARYDAPMLDIFPLEMCGDTRVWSHDRIHGSTFGHTRIAEGMAELLGVPDADPDWATPDPAYIPGRVRGLVRDLGWVGGYMTPWLAGQLRAGRASPAAETVDAPRAKRPALQPVTAGGLSS